jgi:hypothetical protein
VSCDELVDDVFDEVFRRCVQLILYNEELIAISTVYQNGIAKAAAILAQRVSGPQWFHDILSSRWVDQSEARSGDVSKKGPSCRTDACRRLQHDELDIKSGEAIQMCRIRAVPEECGATV